MQTMSTGRPAPKSSTPAATGTSWPVVVRATPTASDAKPHAIGRSSPVRRMIPVMATPARIAPTPCTALSTPTNSTGRPRPSSTIAK